MSWSIKGIIILKARFQCIPAFPVAIFNHLRYTRNAICPRSASIHSISMSASKTVTHSNKTQKQDGSIIIKEVFEAALNAVKPSTMVSRNLRLEGNVLEVGKGENNWKANLDGKRLHVVAFGKAVIGMVRAVHDIVGSTLSSGIASIPKGSIQELSSHGKSDLIPASNCPVKLKEGAYLNIPDAESLSTARDIEQLVTSLGSNDVLLTLISGGGSALLPLPASPITLEEAVWTTKKLSKAGASIDELNTVRSHIELLKGGGLAQLAHPARVINLVLSDIIGDRLDFIASGPTVKPTSMPAQALNILQEYLPDNEVPKSVKALLLSEVDAQTKGKHQEEFEHVESFIIGSNRVAIDAAKTCAQELSDLEVVVLTTELSGEAGKAGQAFSVLAHRICQVLDGIQNMNLFHELPFPKHQEAHCIEVIEKCQSEKKALLLLAAGETIVHVSGTGAGGRNQEMCLQAAISLRNIDTLNHDVAFASVSTDGQDGPTDAAGAIVTPHTIGESVKIAIDYLSNNDSYTYFSSINGETALVKTGLTGTNVMDIQLLYIN